MKLKDILRRGAALLLALGLLFGPSPALAQSYYFWLQAVTEDGEPFTEEGAVRCSVYGRDATTGTSIVHTTAALTTAYTLPLASSANGIIHWYSSLDTPVNLKCFTQYGDYAYKNNFGRTRHRLQIDTGSPYKIFRFPYVTNTAPTSTGLTIPTGGIVTRVAIERITILDGAHLDVGFDGNHAAASWNALASRVAIDQRGFQFVHQVGGTAAGTGANVADSHIGLVMRHVMSTGVTIGAGMQILSRPFLVHTGSGLTIRYNTSAGAGIGGHVYVYWTQTHVGANRQPYR